MDKKFWVYIIFSKKYGTLYIGVTNSLERRIYEHKNKIVEGFSLKYGVDKLVYFEEFNNIDDAIYFEKRMKKWNRAWKIRVIEEKNPTWNDLYFDLV